MVSLADNAFSRAGHTSKEKFQILKQLDQVLHPRSHSQETLLPLRPKPVRTELPANVLAELMKPVDREVKTGRRTEKSKTGEKSFVFCVQSREDYYEKRVRKK